MYMCASNSKQKENMLKNQTFENSQKMEQAASQTAEHVL